MRKLSFIDSIINEVDQALKILTPGVASAERISPSKEQPETTLTIDEHINVTGLMRINHCGEICAQALYRSQGFTSKSETIKASMKDAAQEEIDHLVWCEQRLGELNSQPSIFNPAFYAISFGIGTVAGLVGDKWNLGFVAETEEQVCIHLEKHMKLLPKEDKKSWAILNQMHHDEAEHRQHALEQGGAEFPAPVKWAMTAVSKVMTATTYRI